MDLQCTRKWNHNLYWLPLSAANSSVVRRAERDFEMKQPGLDGRHRDENGEIRRKRSDTLVGTLRAQYGPAVAKGYRADAELGTVLKKENLGSLSQLLDKAK